MALQIGGNRPFQVSPGVNVTEIDLTTIVPAVSTTEGAIGGVFHWGPLEKALLIDSEDKLVSRYGKPSNLNPETFWTAANFLAYGNALYVSRGAYIDGQSDVYKFAPSAGSVPALNALNHGIESGNSYIAISATAAGGIYTDTDDVNRTFDNISELGIEVGDYVVSRFFPDGTKVLKITPPMGDFSQSLTDIQISNTDSGDSVLVNQAIVSGGDSSAENNFFVVQLDHNAITFANTSGGTYDYSDTMVIQKPTTSYTAVANSEPMYWNGNTTPYTSTYDLRENLNSYIIKNENHWEMKEDTFLTSGKVEYAAKYPGELGNSLQVSVCDSVDAYSFTGDWSKIFWSSDETWQGSTGDRPSWRTNQVQATDVNGADVTATVDIANNDGIAVSFNIGVGSYTGTVNVNFSGISAVTDWLSTSGGNADANTAAAVAAAAVSNFIQPGDVLQVGSNSIGYQDLIFSSASATPANVSGANVAVTVSFENKFALSTDISSDTTFDKRWKFYNLVANPPGSSDYVQTFGNGNVDQMHVVVADLKGKITGVPGTVLEVWENLSRATDAKASDGEYTYYKDIINDNSNWIWSVKDRAGAASATALEVLSSSHYNSMTLNFIGGRDGSNEAAISMGALLNAYDQFKDPEKIDISLVLTGKSRGGTNGTQVANYIIDNICEKRKDCVAYISPEKADTVKNVAGDIEKDVIDFRNSLTSSSYAVLDSGYKYQYDRYNDVYRWLPLNGDIAGLAVRTDQTRDPWWSPAGFNRGQIKNIIKLAWNPSKTQRDQIYKNDINPVVVFPGQGTVLYGDKTILGKPSAFDRINVRRLFIVLEKAIAAAAKFTLFEFNDEFTRASFRNLIEPFLRDVQGRRGIYDFKVICDETNNTPEVIDRNEFVGDIYIKPARSINFIQLNFVAVRTGVEFSEVVGRF